MLYCLPAYDIEDLQYISDMIWHIHMIGSTACEHMPTVCMSALQLTYVLGDEGIPANYRQMNGFGVNTFKMVTKEGEETLIKWHWCVNF